MSRSTHLDCIAVAAFTGVLIGGIVISYAQPPESQKKADSGGTQGLQERLYEERMRELQQSQSQPRTESPQSRESIGGSAGQSSRGDATSGRVQGNPEGRTGDSGSGSSRQTEQRGNK